MCAGLMDKNGRSKEQAIVDEIKEELGYEVSVDDVEFVTKSRAKMEIGVKSLTSSCWKRRIDWSKRLHVLRGSNSGTKGL